MQMNKNLLCLPDGKHILFEQTSTHTVTIQNAKRKEHKEHIAVINRTFAPDG